MSAVPPTAGVLEAFAQHLALEQHFAQYPSARPSLGDLAIAVAELDGHPLRANHALLHAAAKELSAFKPDASGEDVVIYAMGIVSRAAE